MEHHEQQYAKGFNNGYLIAKHEPELYSTIEKGVQSKNEYMDGFTLGGKEYEMEKHHPTKHYETKEPDKEIERDR